MFSDISMGAELINQTVEKLVRKRPEQYLWIYKYFSSRPTTTPSPRDLFGVVA